MEDKATSMHDIDQNWSYVDVIRCNEILDYKYESEWLAEKERESKSKKG